MSDKSAHLKALLNERLGVTRLTLDKALGLSGASPPYGVVNSYPECFSGFSCFVGQRSYQNLGVGGRAKFPTIGTFPLVAHVR